MSVSTFATAPFSAIQQTPPHNRQNLSRVRKTCCSKGFTNNAFSFPPACPRGSVQLSRYTGLAMGWTVRGSNPGGEGGEIFRTLPHQHCDPPSLLYNGYRVCPGGKTTGAWGWLPTPSSAEVKKREQLYIYSPSGLPWLVLGWTLPLPSPACTRFAAHIVCTNACVVRVALCRDGMIQELLN
jgi:hypothetical protein